MITIRFEIDTAHPNTYAIAPVSRWAQDQSKTWDHSITVCRVEDARKFETIAEAHAWLARYGFMRRNCKSNTGFSLRPIPAPFKSWELEGVTRETPVNGVL